MSTLIELVEQERERFKVEGAAVAVIHDGATLLSQGFGSRNRDANLPVTDKTLFAIGSSTKAFTASLVGALVDDGLLEWDKPVREYLPWFRMYDPVASELMTPKDLLCHRSGLPRHDLAWYNNTTFTREEMVRRVRHLPPNKSFREVWQYNNLMYLTAGYLTGEMLGCSWEDAVRRRLLEPMGMTNTNFSTIDSQKSDDFAIGYAEREGKVISVDFRELPLCGPAGNINSCIADMVKWVSVQLDGGRLGDNQIISPNSIRELHAPAMVMPEGPQLWDETYPTGYGLGWMLESYRGHKLVHHGGNIDGFSALVAFAPKDGIGVVVLSNGNGTAFPNVVVYGVLDELLGLPALPWGERYRELQETVRAGMQGAAAHQADVSRDLPPSHPRAEYVGTYVHEGYGSFGITLEGDELVPHFNDLDLICRHRHHDTWDLAIELFEMHIPLTFLTDADGEVSGLSVQLEPTVDPAVFRRQPEAVDPEQLALVTGSYEMGPIRVEVMLKQSKLVASVAGQGEAELEPLRGLVFGLAGQPGTTAEFVVEDGRVTKLVVNPVGVFVPVTA